MDKHVKWFLLLFLLAASTTAIWAVSRQVRYVPAPHSGQEEVLIWFSSQGFVSINSRSIEQALWKQHWRLVLDGHSKGIVRIGADDDVPYALVHEAYVEAWRRQIENVGYVIDQRGRYIQISDTTRADVLTLPGPVVLSMDVSGQLAVDGRTVPAQMVVDVLRFQAAGIDERTGGPDYNSWRRIKLRIAPRSPYGAVKSLLKIIDPNGLHRIAVFEESESMERKWLPLPPSVPQHAIPICTPPISCQ